jgi:hypothetical protein
MDLGGGIEDDFGRLGGLDEHGCQLNTFIT